MPVGVLRQSGGDWERPAQASPFLSFPLVRPDSVLSEVNKWQEKGVFADLGNSVPGAPTGTVKFSP